MKNLVLITFSGHTASFKAEQDAYDALRRYLDRAQQRLKTDPDHQEVLRDLEQSIGEKLGARLRSAEQVLTAADIDAVLAEVGPVDAGSDAGPDPAAPLRRRRLMRIKEDQQLLGICTGLSAYSDIRVDWLRFVALALTGVTGGAFGLVYLGAAFFLPVAATRAEYEAMQSDG